MELSQLQEPDIKTLVDRAFAAVIWAYTGGKAVSFVVASCSQARLQDIAVQEYHKSGTNPDDRTLVPAGRTRLERLPSSRSILIQLCDDHANCIEQLSLPQDIPLQLTFQVTSGGCGVQFAARFDQSSLDESHAGSYLQGLLNSTKTLQTATMADVLQTWSELSIRDRTFLERWNGESQKLISECIHDRISRILARDVGRIAVESWDGRLTRASLELESSSIAALLLNAGVQPHESVGILMYKSKSVPTCMLGALSRERHS